MTTIEGLGTSPIGGEGVGFGGHPRGPGGTRKTMWRLDCREPGP